VVAHFHYVLFGGSIMGIYAGIYHYFPKMFGRLMNETLGKWHFWINLIGMNLTFGPMHVVGLLGMPRRIYTYDANQGWDLFNMMSSVGTAIIIVATLIFIYNFFSSLKSGPRAGRDPWGASTLEWSIPSPPPEYNFAVLPNVTSRYPLWDVTDGHDLSREHHEGHEKRDDRVPTAKELGIPMPMNTFKPVIAAIGLVTMLGGMALKHVNDIAFYVVVGGGATMLVVSLYAWLTSPLEESH
jgi:cytochrome c oxidase subunit 1